ncbi:hypothetical protein X797_007064 [Metarhizium robertsii]|uniref:Uncharacterized protein n=1 Tax=Metarhizium robertsii TaxID=568076 RepID=A0A014N2Q4_9HYPO|nr:hypothetical protein X797_007064 [Metarhizium robertsii]
MGWPGSQLRHSLRGHGGKQEQLYVVVLCIVASSRSREMPRDVVEIPGHRLARCCLLHNPSKLPSLLMNGIVGTSVSKHAPCQAIARLESCSLARCGCRSKVKQPPDSRAEMRRVSPDDGAAWAENEAIVMALFGVMMM